MYVYASVYGVCTGCVHTCVWGVCVYVRECGLCVCVCVRVCVEYVCVSVYVCGGGKEVEVR